MKYLPVLADALFYAAAAALLGFCLLRYFDAPVWAAAVACVLLALASGFLVYLFESRTRAKKYLSAKQREECEAVLLHLALAPPEETAKLLQTALKQDGKDAELQKGELRIEGKPAELSFCMEPLSADAVARIIQRYGANAIFYCNKLSPAAEELIKRFPIELIRGEEVYALLKRTESIPEKLLGAAPRKRHREKLKAIFQKRHARPFFVSGALLLMMSLFTLFPVWYLAAGSTLLLVSVGLRLLAPA